MSYLHSYIPQDDGGTKDYRFEAEGDTGDLLDKVDALTEAGRYAVLSDSRGNAFAGYGPGGEHWSRY